MISRTQTSMGLAGLTLLVAVHALAAAPSLSPAGGKYDTKLPVEISADNLEVLQKENRAIFKGNVIAVQGKIRLKADTMVVYYKQKTDTAGKPLPAPEPNPDAPVPPDAAKNAMGAITLIEVEGNVLVATPEESAKGEKGNYQVDEKLLHLTGDNVILTRDKNILRGTSLEYNMETGRSVLSNNGAKLSGPNGGRVRGIFVPTNDQQAKGPKKKAVSEKTEPAPQ